MNADPKNCCAATEAEPTSEMTTVPMWPIMLLLGRGVCGGWRDDQQVGWCEPKVDGPYVSMADTERFQPAKSDDPRPRGKFLYEQNCALCHNTDGTGKPNQAPPLAGSEWVITP